MVWFICAIALAVLVLASFAAAGRFGGMRDAVVDTPLVSLPTNPDDPFDPGALRFRRARFGYDPDAVDDFLRRAASGVLSADELQGAVFRVARSGYDVEQVDDVLDQLAARSRRREASVGEIAAPAAPVAAVSQPPRLESAGPRDDEDASVLDGSVTSWDLWSDMGSDDAWRDAQGERRE